MRGEQHTRQDRSGGVLRMINGEVRGATHLHEHEEEVQPNRAEQRDDGPEGGKKSGGHGRAILLLLLHPSPGILSQIGLLPRELVLLNRDLCELQRIRLRVGVPE